MGTTASVDADSDGLDDTTRGHAGHGSPGREHVWKKVAAIRMAAKGFKILRPGRKIDFKNIVVINKSGFSVSSMSLIAGEVVAFVWDDPDSNGYNVVQVVHDGDQFRPVPGGIYSGPVHREGHFEHLFQIEGEYKFFSSGLRCTPLTIKVSPRADIQVELREDTFYPSVIHIERGNTVKWSWQMTTVPMAMYEVQYCFKHCSTVDPPDTGNIIATTTGNFKKQFKQEGIYHFQSYSNDQSAKTNFCVVHVKEVNREHKIEIQDTMFKPPIVLIEEGDRVWWRWGKDQCRKSHCLYQVDGPELDHRSDESFIPTEAGFRWPQPTENGIMGHVFDKCGVYYYSDYNNDEAAEYLGTIIVKPKQTDHFVQLGPDGFTPDLLKVKAGDRVWWRWSPRELSSEFSLMEVERCLCANQRTPVAEFDCKNQCQFLEDEAVRVKTLACLDSVQLNSVGVYHYRVADSPNSICTSSIIVQPGPRNYTVHVSDMDFDPKVLSINVGDRVWWVWQGTKNPHNIMQVSHRGNPINNGFCSGAPLDSPSAFVQQFNKSGVYYYVSKNLPKFFGAIVVSMRPKVQEVTLTPQDVHPDPTEVNLNDVVCWTFKGLKQHDVNAVTSPSKLMDLQAANNTVGPRRCMNRLFQEGPLHHFFSKSFWRGGKRDMNKTELEARLSSVIVNEPYDCPVVRLSGKGFFPPTINIHKGQSVLWTWREAGEEEHNIIHVNPPRSETPLSVVQGNQSFNSGKTVTKNSFLYTFDDEGVHCVASQGAPGYAGLVRVLASDERAANPEFESDRLAGIVEPGHVVYIKTSTPDCKLYYTTDGTTPGLHTLTTKSYNPERGVVLKQPGFHVIRAIAVCDSMIQSDIVHSERFWVLGDSADDEEMPSDEDGMDVVDGAPASPQQHLWMTCQPRIKGCFTGPGIVEVFWEPFSPAVHELIRGYQVYLNEVTYCDLFSPDHHSLNVAGLAGGRTYDIYLEVYPNDDMLVPNKSNRLTMRAPLTADGGGPLISLEATDDEATMAIVWMSISTPEYPVAGYKLYLNGKQCGNMVVPDEDSNRCKVVIEECGLDQLYRVAVLAVPEDGEQKPRLSNQLELSLPLETDSITLPPEEDRIDDPDMYNEYVEIREGSGYLPDMETDEAEKPSTEEKNDPQEETSPQEDLPADLSSPESEADLPPTPQDQTPEDSEWDRLRQTYKKYIAKEKQTEKVREEVPRDRVPRGEVPRGSVPRGKSPRGKALTPEQLQTAADIVDYLQRRSTGGASEAKERFRIASNDVMKLVRTMKAVQPGRLPGGGRLPSGRRVSRYSAKQFSDGTISERPPTEPQPSTSKIDPRTSAIILSTSSSSARTKINSGRKSSSRNESSPRLSSEKAESSFSGRTKSASKSSSSRDQTDWAEKFTVLTQEIERLRALVTQQQSVKSMSTASKEEVREERTVQTRDHHHHHHHHRQDTPHTPPHGEDLHPGFYDCEEGLQATSAEFSVRSGHHSHLSIPSSHQSDYGSYTDHRVIGRTEPVDHDLIEIDATQEPWSNRLKTVARAGLALSYMAGKRGTKPDHQVELEVESDSDTTGSRKVIDMSQIAARLVERERTKSRKKGPVIEVMEQKQSPLLNAAVPVSVNAAGSGMAVDSLPVPKVSIVPESTESVTVEWECPRPQSPYKCSVYVVNVVGTNFKNLVNSDISYECSQEMDGKVLPGVQHSWNVSDSKKCLVKGLIPGETYWTYVSAHYSPDDEASSEVEVKSSTLRYTTVGAPVAPQLYVQAIHQYQVEVGWKPHESDNSVDVGSYVVLADGKPVFELKKDEPKLVVDFVKPGETKSVQIVATTNHEVGNSRPSDPIQVSCPRQPSPPHISQQPSYKKGCVVIGWEKPDYTSTRGEEIVLYTVYVDGRWQGEVRATTAGDNNGYQHYFSDLQPGTTNDVEVKAVAGQLKTEPLAKHVFCLSESPPSNTLTITCPAPPESPVLRIESMTSEGVDVTWITPQQFGDAQISGYQILKNGKLYGSTIPPDVQSLRIKDLSLGDKVSLQLVALTEHPVGRNKTGKGSMVQSMDGDSGIDGASHPSERGGDVIDKYGACKAGPKLTFHYTGLVQAPNKVWCEAVTGHSALIVWNKDVKARSHYIAPDSYQVTWWPGDQPEDDINSQHTNNNYLEISGLKPATVYTVVVEARKLQSYSALQEEEGFSEEEPSTTFILTSQSEKLTVRVARPPDPPSNLGVVASTCHSLQVAWDPPREHGVEVIGLRVDCHPVSKDHCNPATTLELLSDVTSCTVEGLCENTEHIVTITAITEEFFDCLEPNHELKKVRSLRPDVKEVPESPWLPRSNIVASTSGTDAPSQLSVVKTTMDSVSLSWKPATVHGSNRLLGQIVRWWETSRSSGSSARWNAEDIVLASHQNLNSQDSHVTVKGLDVGSVYQFIIEAIVSVKTTAEPDADNEGESKNRRTAHVPSKSVVVRTRAPSEQPKLYVAGFTPNTVLLHWERPVLYTVLDPDQEKRPKILRRHLEGYKLLINGKNHMRLAASAQSCTLTKCKPGKDYHVVLVALTCTEEAKKERRRRLRGMSADSRVTSASSHVTPETGDEDDIDESTSEPITVTIPTALPGNIASFHAGAVMSSRDSNIVADWSVHGDADTIRQYNLTWYSHMNPVINKKSIGSDLKKTQIPAADKKSVYELSIEPQTYKEQVKPEVQNVQVIVPGPPDPPELFLKSVSGDEFVVEWGEPRCYGNVKVVGYQMYLNDRKVGSVLNSCHHKAVVPCQPHRTYKVNLVALSDTEGVDDSPKSNTVFVSTHNDGRIPEHSALMMEELISNPEVDGDFKFKVQKVTESTIHLDWSAYVEPEEITGYRVEWNSLAQPAQREAMLGPREQSCTISKCFPGTNHLVRVLALGRNNEVVEKSQQITVQTSSPPDTPLVHVRAVNFKYIAIQWEPPRTYGDAQIRGYKIFVNGIIADEVGAKQNVYSFTKGRPCLEYAFQVQALSTVDKLNSKPSEPLVVTWPGAKAPILKRVPTVSSNSVRVTWERPETTEGVKCKHCKLCCTDLSTEKVVQIVSPIHPDTLSADLYNLKQGTYSVVLEIYLHGTNEVVRSEPIHVEPALTPAPPQITVTVVGLEERRQIDKIMCDLLNKRDQLLQIVKSKNLAKTHGDAEMTSKAAEKLSHVESMIDDCFTSLNHYTGHILAHVSWQVPHTNPEVAVCGYKVLVDGKQYGCSLQSGTRNVRIKLNLNQPIHRLSMVALADKPNVTSMESNVVELLTEPFQPFTFFCFRNIHQKDTRFPSHGCCQYQCSYRAERRPAAKPINQGFVKRRQTPPACQVRDVFEGEFRPLVIPSRRPTILLFWTRWCGASVKMAQFFNRYANENARINNYSTIACDTADDPIGERKELIHMIMDNGWRDDTVIRHYTSESASGDGDGTEDAPTKKRGSRRDDKENVSKLYNIQGVPTIVVIHPDNYIAYQGRYCAFEYLAFDKWMGSVLNTIANDDGDNFNMDDLDFDLKGYQSTCRACETALIHTPEFISTLGSPPTAPSRRQRPRSTRGRGDASSPQRPPSGRISRPSSSKRPASATRRRDNISVSVRPFSATSPGKLKLHQKNPYINPFYTMPPGFLRDRKAWET